MSNLYEIAKQHREYISQRLQELQTKRDNSFRELGAKVENFWEKLGKYRLDNLLIEND